MLTNTYELDHEDVEFLTMACQEMRPSLHDVMGIAQLLSETPLDAENQNCVRAILASTEMMLSVVDNILSCPMVKATMAYEENNLLWSFLSSPEQTSTVLVIRPDSLPPYRGETAKLSQSTAP